MNLHFEFLTVFRQKTGLESLSMDLPGLQGDGPTVLEALALLQGRPQGRRLRVLEGGRIAGGVLLFLRTPEGKLMRVSHAESQRVAPGQSLVLAVAMDGG